VHVAYLLANRADHAVSVAEVQVTVRYVDGDTSDHTFDGAALGPGEELNVERTLTAGARDNPPDGAQIGMRWRWADDDVARQCPTGE
jgi:hypothetical protein